MIDISFHYPKAVGDRVLVNDSGRAFAVIDLKADFAESATLNLFFHDAESLRHLAGQLDALATKLDEAQPVKQVA